MENKKEIPDFSQTIRNRVPKEFIWRIEDIYPDIRSWEKDKALYIEMIANIDEQAKDWTDSPQKMLRFMNHVSEIEKLEEKTYSYPRLFSDSDMSESKWQAMKGEIHAASVEMSSKLAFMDPDILRLGKTKIDDYIKVEPGLKDYEMDFDSILRMKNHILSTDKERILAETALFSGTPKKAADILNDVDIPTPKITLSDGKRVDLNTANYILHRESNIRSNRLKVMHTYWKRHAKFRNTHATLLDGAVKHHFFISKVRRFENCLEAALYLNNIDTKVYHTLIETVRENLKPLHRYLLLKARLLNIEKLSYDDIYASSVPSINKMFTIEEAKEIVQESLRPLGKEYTDILGKAFDSGWIDIYPNKAKRTGAYSMGVYNVHPYVLMNYNGTLSNVSTLAHEFGHSLHSWYSDISQPYPLAQYPIFLAEIASTFNETLLVHHLLKTETDDLVKLYILDKYLDEFRGTLFRQSLFAEFELDMHRQVEKGQTLTSDWLDHRYLELARHYYGHKEGIITVPQHIENEWSNIHHFYYNFYVYQYSTGIAASTALAESVLNGDQSNVRRYLNFLKSGGSKYPLDTLKEAGVDLTTPTPIQVAIHKFDSIIGEMEIIIKRLEKK